MINFPTFHPIASVVQAVQLNIAETQPTADKLPTIGYIGFAEPDGVKAVIELDHTGKVIGTTSEVAQNWVTANGSALDLMFANLTTAHGALPEQMTLALVGYILHDTLTLVDAQLVMDGNPSAYWLSVTVLLELTTGVTCVETAFKDALYAELDFNNPEQFIEAATKTAATPTLWQCSPHAEFAAAPVLRDPYRIVV